MGIQTTFFILDNFLLHLGAETMLEGVLQMFSFWELWTAVLKITYIQIQYNGLLI